ncbi:BnaC02g17430D [Brassica napus]|uniref:BnaC02g17430D protein n=1 Tax=Brassica napus TaxID=3708 RepID=A0A078H1N0_BRANA|nr:BnaC02g17430D [Brassica napus]
MYDRTEDRFNALEKRIVMHADAFVASGLYEEQVDPAVASQRSIFAVGMICCDGEGHLNDKSILLQSSFKEIVKIKKITHKIIMIFVNWADHYLYDIAHERKISFFKII